MTLFFYERSSHRTLYKKEIFTPKNLITHNKYLLIVDEYLWNVKNICSYLINE
jgi:hypothetical protein